MGSNISKPKVPTNLTTRDQKRHFIRSSIDLHGFRWLVFGVAATGFFTDSYNLFATNVILPSLAFIYWPDAKDAWRETLINSVTLGGSLVGQLLFGYLTDRFGRTRLYGAELVIVIISTIAFSLSGSGYDGSLHVLTWFAFTRFFMGLGIGAEYPLSAAICTEWASTQARARTMAAVFLMQPLGQLISQLVGLVVLVAYNHWYHLEGCKEPAAGVAPYCGRSIDTIWRWVTGVGAIPALVAIYFRFRIPDPGLYELDVNNEGDLAVRNTIDVYHQIPASHAEETMEMHGLVDHDHSEREDADLDVEAPLPAQFSYEDMHDYFWVQGNWRSVAGTSLCWFLLDLAFFGLGMNSPRTIAKIWATTQSSAPVPSWNTIPSHPEYSIYDVLLNNAIQNLATVCTGSLLGSILLLLIIDYIPRKEFLSYSFLWMAALFFVTGGSFFGVFQNDLHAVTIVLVALCHFSFNLGPNTLTFIIPAEIFPTRYRATCHGIAAAAGKLGSVIVTSILPYLPSSEPDDAGLGFVFIFFGFVMALGSVFTWAWIPSVQKVRDGSRGFKIPSKSLEELSEGVAGAERHGEIIGLRNRLSAVAAGWRRGRTHH